MSDFFIYTITPTSIIAIVTSTIKVYEMIKNNERLHWFVDEKCFMKNTDEFWDFLNRIYSNENKDYRFFHFEA